MIQKLIDHAVESPYCTVNCARVISSLGVSQEQAAISIRREETDKGVSNATFDILLLSSSEATQQSMPAISNGLSDLIFSTVTDGCLDFLRDEHFSTAKIPNFHHSKQSQPIHTLSTELRQVAISSEHALRHCERFSLAFIALVLNCSSEVEFKEVINTFLSFINSNISDSLAVTSLIAFYKWRISELNELWKKTKCLGSVLSVISKSNALSEGIRKQISSLVIIDLISNSPTSAFITDLSMIKSCFSHDQLIMEQIAKRILLLSSLISQKQSY